MTCNNIQTSISLWKEDLETVIQKNKQMVQVKNVYYWLSYDGLKKIIPNNPYDRLESEQTGIEKKIHFIIDNK